MNRYETVFILNPVLSEPQVKEAVQKYESFLAKKGAKMIHKEEWGLKRFAYPIQKKKSGFYILFDFQMDGAYIAPFELAFRRDDAVMRYLTVKMDKHAAAWADKRAEKIKASKK